MDESPKVAILQNTAGVLQVTEYGFENWTAYFTRTIYDAMEWAVGNGDNAPFVGHNAFIRWSAIQDIGWTESTGSGAEDKKWWSEGHVSEDFDLSIRLHVAGYMVRLVTYHGNGFREGVSLGMYDEIARWEKYMYGCSEIVFNPLWFWVFKGPFTRGFGRFLWSNLRLTSKLSIIAYICNYYAIAAAFPLSIINYFVLGWVRHVDKFYISSWKVYIGVLVVFNGLAPLGISMVKHRLGKTTFLISLVEAIKWSPFFALYFMGISYHLCYAALCHMLSIRMEWTVTAKEVERGGFRLGLNRIVRDFKYMYILLFGWIGAMVYLGLYAPLEWRITSLEAVGPLALQISCHFLLPTSGFIV